MSDFDSYSGTITANAQTIVADCQNQSGAYLVMNGTHAGINLAFEGTADGTVWQNVIGYRLDSTATTTFLNATAVISSNNSVQYYVILGGFKQFRVRATAYTSGTMIVNITTVIEANPIQTFLQPFSVPAALADGASNPTSTSSGADQLLFNGTTWDRGRNNNNAVAVDLSSARTSTGTGVTATNYNHAGAFIYYNVTAFSGTTPTLVFKVQYSVDGTNFVDLDATNAASASITGVASGVIKVYPGIPTVAAGSCNSPLPRVWRLAWTIGGTTPSFTFTTFASYIL